MSGDILDAIGAAVQANLCGCGCGQQIHPRGPSPDFVNEKHQQASQEARRNPTPRLRPPQEWLDRLNGRVVECVEAEDCDDLSCRCCHSPTPAIDPDETPMARVVRETSSLRRAIDRILGKSR